MVMSSNSTSGNRNPVLTVKVRQGCPWAAFLQYNETSYTWWQRFLVVPYADP